MSITDVILQTPLNNPGTIYCAGANYYDHAQEMGVSIEKDSIEPLFFLKSCGSIIGPNQNIKLPKDYSEKYDWDRANDQDRLGFVRKVYGILATQLVITACFVYLCMSEVQASIAANKPTAFTSVLFNGET